MRQSTLLVSILLSAVSASYAQPIPRQHDIWHASAGPGGIATVTRYGGGTVSGYYFNVATRPDGSLPVLVTDVAWQAGHNLVLYKRVSNTQWALFCNWAQDMNATTLGGGIQLEAGDYLYASTYAAGYKGLLVTGFWQTPPQQATHWRQNCGYSNYVTVPTSSGSFSGFKFNVPTRPDGAIPCVTGSSMWAPPTTVRILRRVNATDYELYCDWRTSEANPGPGILLPPGDYINVSQPSVGLSLLQSRYCVMLYGFMSPP